eukprot:TRINITY_DN31906_c0_g2_i1.p1 TRINITY_DN31906_c0_g2~~TRINITY_DN31906_c0_g2_i1.p1  ORF type:complete len:763 (-),score=145.99 TRINITY_DN31906_c0_g2_i1:151-2439(-)
MAPKAIINLAHELLTMARDHGSDDGTWEDIFNKLRKKPAALVRPEVRKMSLLHQAAYWGHKIAVETLLKEFKADPSELTADDDNHDAASVAEANGHPEIAKLIKDFAGAVDAADAAKAPAPSSSSTKAKAEAASLDDIALANELLSSARDDGGEDATWKAIFVKLRESPGALKRPSMRKFSLLHQAAYWGKRDAVDKLLTEFSADPKEITADGEGKDAAAIAESRGHADLAKFLRKAAMATSTTIATEKDADVTAKEVVDDDEEEASAKSPYDPEKAESNTVKHDMVGAVSVWLCLRKNSDGKSQWEPYSPKQNAQIEAARSSGGSTAKCGSATLDIATIDFGSMRETSGGLQKKVCFFTVLWQWDSGEGGKAKPEWQPYAPELQWELESSMCAAKAVCEVSTDKSKKYIVDLVSLRQQSALDSFRTRRVRRMGVPLRCALPTKVCDETGTWLDLSHQPDYWSLGSSEDSLVAKRFDLPMDHEIVAQISEWMNSTIRTGHKHGLGMVAGTGSPTKGMEVVRVEVVQQPLLWRRYCCYKERMKAQVKMVKAHAGTKYLEKNPMAIPRCTWLDQDVNEAYFWHGSGKSPDGTIDLVDSIVSVGHEPSDENSEVMEVSDGASSRFAKTSSMFGSGVYLADLSSKANLYVPCPKCYQGAYFRDPCTCTKKDIEKADPYRMLLCRAVLGRVHIEKKYKDERYKGDFNPAKKLGADSVVGEVQPGLAFREYVVYNDSASYPEFIVHFRRLATAPKLAAPPPKKKAKMG